MTAVRAPERRSTAVRAAYVVVERTSDGFALSGLDARGVQLADPQHLPAEVLADAVIRLEADAPRWVWDTAAVYPALLETGVTVRRAHDLRLCRTILRRAAATAAAFAAVPADGWDEADTPAAAGVALFDLADGADGRPDAADELRRQLAAVEDADDPGRIRLLLALESAGALVAAEMAFAGLPWSEAEHDRILTELVGPRPLGGARPRRLEELATAVRALLGAPELNPDSPPELLRALRRVGLAANSTRSADLQQLEHPVVPPLLEYKKLARLLAANGWHWLDSWVVDGRFRPDYLVGGVVTGRWATRGGGALQLPKQIRGAVVADPGWRLVVADAAQLEPRVLAGLAHDTALAEAGRGRDLYEGIVASGAVPDRASAKYGVLGALYGATRGPGGRLVPRLAQRFPRALGMVEDAARTGERGGTVSTLLGRTSPGGEPSAAFASGLEPIVEERSSERARALARERGRFTRNFVVQGSAAEWALCWLADLRTALAALSPGPMLQRPHLVYFLHDEVLVHTPAALAEPVADAVRASAAVAGRTLFGGFPVDFPLDVAIVDRYGDA